MKCTMPVLLLVLFGLNGCTDDKSATPSAADRKTVFDSQLNALDKTRNIENVLQQSADARQQELDEQ
ncbi:MAG: hypothetical protein QNK15_09265 [Cycloclasticus sp.]|nr:hypothetical protein [Cycloclasticus sp.]